MQKTQHKANMILDDISERTLTNEKLLNGPLAMKDACSAGALVLFCQDP